MNHIEFHILSAGCTIERYRYDYGYDGFINTYNEIGEYENGRIEIQLKSTDSLKYSTANFSYREFENALLRLGYRKTLKNDGWKLYINDEHGASVRINPLNTPDRMMILGAFAGEAYNMEMMGVIEHRDDIAKMIEQDRLDALAREQNTPVGAAA